LRGYAQRDPLNEYKSESFTLFEAMLARLRVAVTEQLMHVQLAPNQAYEMEFEALPEMRASHVNPLTGEDEFELAEAATGTDGPLARKSRPGGSGGSAPARNRGAAAVAADPKDPSTWGKVSRNAACPCGSGKKFKHCHGALVA
jgi:preprotein translocase subunit SecA